MSDKVEAPDLMSKDTSKLANTSVESRLLKYLAVKGNEERKFKRRVTKKLGCIIEDIQKLSRLVELRSALETPRILLELAEHNTVLVLSETVERHHQIRFVYGQSPVPAEYDPNHHFLVESTPLVIPILVQASTKGVKNWKLLQNNALLYSVLSMKVLVVGNPLESLEKNWKVSKTVDYEDWLKSVTRDPSIPHSLVREYDNEPTPEDGVVVTQFYAKGTLLRLRKD